MELVIAANGQLRPFGYSDASGFDSRVFAAAVTACKNTPSPDKSIMLEIGPSVPDPPDGRIVEGGSRFMGTCSLCGHFENSSWEKHREVCPFVGRLQPTSFHRQRVEANERS